MWRVPIVPAKNGLPELLGLCVRKFDLEHRILRLEPGTTKNGEGREASLLDLQALNLEYQDTLRTIEKLGKRYRWSPTVRGGDFLGLQRMFTWNRRSEDEAWENWAVFWLLSHVESSGLSPSRILRFRKCRQCSAWFYALTDHQLHCSSACRQKFHANSPEFKAKRAKYMRERYRPQEKERELKAKPKAERKK